MPLATEGLTLNWEFALQFGRFNEQDIRAWTIASDTSYALKRYPLSGIGVSANIASGDKDPNDNKLGTFNPLLPRGNYFSELAILGPRNFYNIQPYLTFQPHPAVSVTKSTTLALDGGRSDPAALVRQTGSRGATHYVELTAKVLF
ncbi:alginate export family protein [Alishewanella longhuensis]